MLSLPFSEASLAKTPSHRITLATSCAFTAVGVGGTFTSKTVWPVSGGDRAVQKNINQGIQTVSGRDAVSVRVAEGAVLPGVSEVQQ